MSLRCKRPHRECRLGLVRDSLDDLAKINFSVGAESVDDLAHQVLAVGIECGGLRRGFRKPEAMKRHDANNTCAKKLHRGLWHGTLRARRVRHSALCPHIQSSSNSHGSK